MVCYLTVGLSEDYTLFVCVLFALPIALLAKCAQWRCERPSHAE